MRGVTFELKPVDGKPKRTHRRSKYDPIIDEFLSGGNDLVRVEVEDRDADYMRYQLIRIIESRGLEKLVKASVVNGELYLEKA